MMGEPCPHLGREISAGSRRNLAPHRVEILIHDQRLHRAHLERLERVVDAEAVLARVLRDIPEMCP